MPFCAFSCSKKSLTDRASIGDQWDIHTKGGTTMLDMIKRFINDEEGQDLVEYALLLVFLALAAIAVLPTLGSSVNRVFSQSNSSLNAS
jgi:pilus assembly protein Flp/PilA